MIYTISLCIVIAVFIPVTVIVKRKKEVAQYNNLDKTGVWSNIILSVLYLGFYLVNLIVMIAAMEYGGFEYHLDNKVLLNFLWCILASLPFLCVLIIFVSVILRKRGHSKKSFFIQFVPILAFFILYGFLADYFVLL